VRDFTFSNNFTFCYSCGLNEYKKSYCSVCKKINDGTVDPDGKMVQCVGCSYWSHLKCSKVSEETLKEIEGEA